MPPKPNLSWGRRVTCSSIWRTGVNKHGLQDFCAISRPNIPCYNPPSKTGFLPPALDEEHKILKCQGFTILLLEAEILSQASIPSQAGHLSYRHKCKTSSSDWYLCQISLVHTLPMSLDNRRLFCSDDHLPEVLITYFFGYHLSQANTQVSWVSSVVILFLSESRWPDPVTTGVLVTPSY